MAEIKKIDDRPVIDYMARDYESILASMRKLVPYKLPEWKDYRSEADFGNVLMELFAHMGDMLSYYQDRVANESFLGTAQTRKSIIQHLRLIGYTLSTAAPASATLTITVPLSQSSVVIPMGAAFATKSQKSRPSVRFEYTGEDKTITDLPVYPKDKTKRFFSINVEEGRLIRNEKIGTSDGTPNQKFMLCHSGLIIRSLNDQAEAGKDIDLIVTPNNLPSADPGLDNQYRWNLRETLAFSREEQKDYVIEIDENDTATVIFGDKTFGAIPTAQYNIFASYRVGGGTKGNVSAGTINTIVEAPSLSLLGAKVTNDKPATGGADRETIDHAVMHAPAVFRSLKRAVTAQDYEALALNYKGVGKVRAKAGNWNTVNLFVAPEGGGYASDTLRADLLTYFEDKRTVTTMIEVNDPQYREIYISADLNIERSYIRGDVTEKVTMAAANLLSFDNVDFAQTLYLSKFYELIQNVAGVNALTITEFRTDLDPVNSIATNGTIQLGENEIPVIPGDLPYSGGINIVQIQGGVSSTGSLTDDSTGGSA